MPQVGTSVIEVMENEKRNGPMSHTKEQSRELRYKSEFVISYKRNLSKRAGTEKAQSCPGPQKSSRQQDLN